MSLKFTMLGYLDMSPYSGYDLKKIFNSNAKLYWYATHSQIYRTLLEMEKEGLIKVELVNQVDFPNKKVYHITKKGEEELIKWLSDPSELNPSRHKLLSKISWSDRIPSEVIIKNLNDYGKKLEERLEILNSERYKEMISYGRTKREKFLWRSVHKNGLSTYESELKWVHETIEGLGKF